MNRDARSLLREAASTIFRSYAVIFFSGDVRFGALLLAATMLVPRNGLLGLAGLSIAAITAWVVRLPEEQIRSGSLLFNSLLLSLGAAWAMTNMDLSMMNQLAIVAACSVWALLLSAALRRALPSCVPVLSLPLVVAATVIVLAQPTLPYDMPAWRITHGLVPEPTGLPDAILGGLRAFGAIFFLPDAVVGLVILVAITGWSRIAAVMALVGLASGAGALVLLGAEPTESVLAICGFNFVLASIAMGAVYFVPGAGSYLLAIASAPLVAVFWMGLSTLLAPYNVAPLPMPFVLTVWLLVGSMALRRNCTCLVPAAPSHSPESAWREALAIRTRWPDLHLPTVDPPFRGERVVTQGFNGAFTHRGAWRHALDFEVHDERSRPCGSGREASLENYYTLGSPVHAPVDGLVTQVIDDVVDNPIGHNNLARNWGNYVVIRTSLGTHVTLCHFRQGGIDVEPGTYVRRGDLLGRCGNSGRSPVPHLHLQVQAGEDPSAPTLNFRLGSHVLRDGGAHRWLASGLPSTGDRLTHLEVDASVAQCLSSWADGTLAYRVEGPDGQTRREEITCHFAEDGCVVLTTSACKRTHMVLRVTSNALFGLSLTTSLTPSILSLWWPALARMPFSSETGLSWHDQIEADPYFHASRRFLAAATVGFRPACLLKVCGRVGRVEEADGRFVVAHSCRVEAPAFLRGHLEPPKQIEMEYSAGGVLRGQVWTTAGCWRFERETRPRHQASPARVTSRPQPAAQLATASSLL